jgi:hypothetical protein
MYSHAAPIYVKIAVIHSCQQLSCNVFHEIKVAMRNDYDIFVRQAVCLMLCFASVVHVRNWLFFVCEVPTSNRQ